jgi:hypothetical protein
VAAPIAAGRLTPLLERWSAPFPGYFLCYPQQRQMAPALRAFIDARPGVQEPRLAFLTSARAQPQFRHLTVSHFQGARSAR